MVVEFGEIIPGRNFIRRGADTEKFRAILQWPPAGKILLPSIMKILQQVSMNDDLESSEPLPEKCDLRPVALGNAPAEASSSAILRTETSTKPYRHRPGSTVIHGEILNTGEHWDAEN